MFYLSKIVWAAAQPSSLIALAMAAGAIFALGGKTGPALRLLMLGASLYAVLGISPLANFTLALLEERARQAAAPDLEGAAGIIVLGGPLEATQSRLTEALLLANRFSSLPVIFSGGSADLIGGQPAEARLARNFFEAFGIVPPRLVLEKRSRNTAENAAFTAGLLNPRPDQKWIFITSAYHMQRAKAHFEAHGFRLLPRPVDFKTKGRPQPWELFSKPSQGLSWFDLASKEWVGLGVSWVLGDIARTR